MGFDANQRDLLANDCRLEPQDMPSPAVGRLRAPVTIKPQDECLKILSRSIFFFIFFKNFCMGKTF
jgi:hypothetical protein